MILSEVGKTYFKGKNVLEVFDHKQANDLFDSMSISSRRNDIAEQTGWIYLGQLPSIKKGRVATVFVCKKGLIY